MAKIHTHYDNLKVARMAPPEVIRAAYKALSQKYHPDKNPGDEKAARIMAILNTAYSTLSDEQRRKEHDAWISAEEWEVEWLESEGKGRDTIERWEGPDKHQQIVPYRPSRDPKWWAVLLGCLGVGWGSGALMVAPPGLIPALFVLGHKPVAASVEDDAFETRPEPRESRIITVSEFRMPESACTGEVRPPLAPNGTTWPAQSGYINGYKVGNLGGNTQLTIDNSHNANDVFVKLFDIEQNQTVRYLLLKAHQKFTLAQLKTGNYELRHQVWGGTKCEAGTEPVAATNSSSAETAPDKIADAKAASPAETK
jgi:hypothetical protein